MEAFGYYFLINFGLHIKDKSLIIIIFAHVAPKASYVEVVGDNNTMHLRVTLY